MTAFSDTRHTAFSEGSNLQFGSKKANAIRYMKWGMDWRTTDLILASGTEWKTPPLWGIGLTEVVNGHTNFLHDGRAKNILEAIMWHGDEATSAKEYVRKITKAEHDALITSFTFLNSL